MVLTLPIYPKLLFYTLQELGWVRHIITKVLLNSTTLISLSIVMIQKLSLMRSLSEPSVPWKPGGVFGDESLQRQCVSERSLQLVSTTVCKWTRMFPTTCLTTILFVAAFLTLIPLSTRRVTSVVMEDIFLPYFLIEVYRWVEYESMRF